MCHQNPSYLPLDRPLRLWYYNPRITGYFVSPSSSRSTLPLPLNDPAAVLYLRPAVPACRKSFNLLTFNLLTFNLTTFNVHRHLTPLLPISSTLFSHFCPSESAASPLESVNCTHLPSLTGRVWNGTNVRSILRLPDVALGRLTRDARHIGELARHSFTQSALREGSLACPLWRATSAKVTT